MKSVIHLFIIIICLTSCTQDKRSLLGETEFQLKLNAEYKDATTSPLKDKDRANFRGLDFFKFDSTYVVIANLIRTPDEKPFKMKTTTNRLPEYVKYGVIEFQINGDTHKLNLYRNLDIRDLEDLEDYEDYLFLPFIDHTNGVTTYGGGRYVDARIPEGNTIEIDFNKAYNPYCAYNEKYSCPIVPRQNYLPIEVKAGVKAFAKN